MLHPYNFLFSSSAILLFPIAGIAFIIGISLIFYFIPSIVAFSRKCPSSLSILALNLFFGWTLVGWVASLVWSLRNYEYSAPTKVPPVTSPVPSNRKSITPIRNSVATSPQAVLQTSNPIKNFWDKVTSDQTKL